MGPVITGSFEKRAPGRGHCVVWARHVTLTVPFLLTFIDFLEAPGNYRAR